MQLDIQFHSDIWKLADYNLIVTLIFLVAAWRWGDWRNWQIYYPTFIYFILNDFGYGYVTYNQPLWQYESYLLNTTLSDILITVIGYPSIILLFLTYYPKGFRKRIVYIAIWGTLYFIFVELVSHKLGFITYHNGWNIYYAFLFVYSLFPMFRLHHKKPLVAWIIASSLAMVSYLWFGLSISKMK